MISATPRVGMIHHTTTLGRLLQNRTADKRLVGIPSKQDSDNIMINDAIYYASAS